MTLRGWRQPLALLAAVTALAGCVGPGRIEGGAYVVASKGYRVVLPPGWARVESDADLALRHAAREAGLMVHGTCEEKAPRRPLTVLARHLRFGLRDVGGLEQAPVTVAGQPGIRSRFTARLGDVPVTVQALTLRARRCVYDLVVVAAPGRLDEVADDFERLTRSFDLLEAVP